MIGENSGRGRGVWPGLLVGVAGRVTGGEVGRLLTSLSRGFLEMFCLHLALATSSAQHYRTKMTLFGFKMKYNVIGVKIYNSQEHCLSI